jgi:hypothetical protein
VDCFNMVGIVNSLVGCQPGVRILARNGPTSTISSTSVIAYPTGGVIRNGDIAIISDRATSTTANTAPTDVTPTGFTQLVTTAVTTATTSLRSSMYFKLLNGSESGTSIIGMAGLGGGATTKILIIFRPSFTYASYAYTPTTFSSSSTASGTTVSSQTIDGTILTNNSAAILLAQYTTTAGGISARTSTGPLGFTETNFSTTHYFKFGFMPLGTDIGLANSTIGITTASTVIVLHSGILTIK